MPQQSFDFVESAFRRIGLIGPEETLPAPFHSAHGEAEDAGGYYFEIAGNIVAAKVPHSEKSRKALWEEVGRYRRDGEHPALLPAPMNEESDNVLVYRDGEWIAKALRRLRLLDEASPAPLPRRMMSGLAGYSRLYLIHLEDGDIDVLVKFDRPDRLRHEWSAIARVRATGRIPSALQLPVTGSSLDDDGVLVIQVFQNKTAAREVVQFNEFIEHRLLDNWEHVADALKLLERFLRELYVDAKTDCGTTVWAELNAELAGAVDLSTFLKHEGIWKADQATFGIVGLPRLGRFANPLNVLAARMRKDTGKLLRATTHGDLQSTNVLVGLSESPEELAVIDIEKLASGQPVVEDLVRIEADFWRSVFSAIAARLFEEHSSDDQVRLASEAMLIALDKLDGRTQQVRTHDERVWKLAESAAHFVFAIREMSWSILRAGASHYWPVDYFGALRFYYLKAMLRPLVHNDRLRLRVALLGATMAEDTVRSMERGILTTEHGPLRTWTEGFPQRAVRAQAIAPRGGASTLASMSPLGAATSIFSQRGLILSIIRRSFEVHEHDVVVKRTPGARKGFAFATHDLADVTGQLNAQAFRRQKWKGTGAHLQDNIFEKSVRNRAHIEKNPKTILLIQAPSFDGFAPKECYVGMTHVIPLNEAGYRDYCDGKIEDNVMGPDAIAVPGEEARALLLFSLAFDTMSLHGAYRRKINERKAREWKYGLATELLEATAFHVNCLMEAQGNLDGVELLAQNDLDAGIRALFELLHFEETDYVSADGNRIRSVLCRRGA